MKKILNFGSLNMDFVYAVAHTVRGGETEASLGLQVFPGGKGLNQSIAEARAGLSVFHAGLVGEDGSLLLDKGLYIMEIKTSLAMPVWLADMLTELGIHRTSFSKYGTEYKEYLKQGSRGERRFYPALARGGKDMAAAL